jgi:hypothetical protein
LLLWTKQHVLPRCQAIKWWMPSRLVTCPPNCQDTFFLSTALYFDLSLPPLVSPRSLDPVGELLQWRCIQMTELSCKCRVSALQLLQAKIPRIRFPVI